MSVKVINPNALDTIARMLLLTSQSETYLEKMKQVLCSIPNFNPEHVWMHITESSFINQSSLRSEIVARFL
jgi:hypothetical protein